MRVNFLSSKVSGDLDYKQDYKIEICIERENDIFDGGFIKFKDWEKSIININQLTNEDELKKHKEQGLLYIDDEWIRFTSRGLDLSDIVNIDLLP